MHIMYKLIALSVVFGLVLTDPVAKVTPESFDDLAHETGYEISDELPINENDDKRTFDVVVPTPDPISLVLKIATKVLGLKKKALSVAVVAIKWIISKSLFLAIGAIATLAFCKSTNMCNLSYEPAVYEIIPAQVKDFVTPARLEEVQQFLYSAMKQYADKEARSDSWFY